MALIRSSAKCSGTKFVIHNDKGKRIASAYLYVMHNRHDRPFGLIEDVYVVPDARGRGIGKRLVKEIIKAATLRNCYKLIATSRYSRDEVHKIYLSFSFKDYGKEFRLDI